MQQSAEFKAILEKAQNGDSYSQWWLGEAYANGEEGVDKDEKEAHEWYLKAANQGDADAQERIGRDYLFGLGAKKISKRPLCGT
ncbi:MAG: hypothetical protein COC15_00260 [Legionellales bacterium]|nr:MAG: hypothetical protein COC15_00260 [Legionellales bacterium]